MRGLPTVACHPHAAPCCVQVVKGISRMDGLAYALRRIDPRQVRPHAGPAVPRLFPFAARTPMRRGAGAAGGRTPSVAAARAALGDGSVCRPHLRWLHYCSRGSREGSFFFHEEDRRGRR